MSNKKNQYSAKMQDIKKKGVKKTVEPDPSDNLEQTSTETTQAQEQPAPQPSTQQLAEEVNLRQENEELKNKNIRLLADMQNLMRQHDMDVLQAKKSAKKEISLSFLDFVSTMNLAFTFAPNGSDQAIGDFVANLKNTLNKSLQNLKAYNIEIIVPEFGEAFNPEYMTGINEPPEGEDNPVVRGVVSAGLKVEGQVIKPVMITF